MRKVIYSAKSLGTHKKSMKELHERLWDAINSFAESKGWPQDEIPEYFYLKITPTGYLTPSGDQLAVEVRAELGYDGMLNLSEYLDDIIKEYDEDAYFDMDEPGIMSAYVNI